MTTGGDDVRPDVVSALASVDFTRPLTEDDAALLYNSTEAERVDVARRHHDAALEALREAGVLSRRTVWDVNQRQLMALAAVYDVARRYWQPNDNRKPLGDLLKIMTQRDAEQVVWLLRWGAYEPDGGW